MAAGFGTFGDDVAAYCSAQRHFLQAAIRACEKGLQWQQVLDLLVVMLQTAVLLAVVFLQQPPSVLVRSASCGSGLWAF